MWATVALMWVVPFLVLLSDKAKRNRTVLLRVSVVVLIGHWLDLYVTIVPAHSPEPCLTGWDLAIALGAFAAVGWAVTRRDATQVRRGSFSRLRRCAYGVILGKPVLIEQSRRADEGDPVCNGRREQSPRGSLRLST